MISRARLRLGMARRLGSAAFGVLMAMDIAVAAERQMPTFPKIPENSLTLAEALRLTLANDPDIVLAQEESAAAGGRFQEASGQFDHAFTLGSSLDYDRHALSPSDFRAQNRTRLTFRTLAESFQDVADQLQRELEEVETGRIVVPCDRLGTGENVLREGNEIVIIDRITGERTRIECTTREGVERIRINDELIELLIARETDPARRAELERLRRESTELQRQTLQGTIDLLNFVARELREALRKLGPAPREEESFTTTWDLGYRMPYRNGIVLTPRLFLQTIEANFVGKTRRAGFGGKGDPNNYTAGLGFSLQVPLGKGIGSDATGAPERAAGIGYRASVSELRHQTAANLLRTVRAYWNLVAAQQILRLQEQSAGRQAELESIAQALLEADEITRGDLNHVRARLADARTAVFQARQGLLDARLALAREIGLTVEDEAEAPLASDPFPEVVDPDRIAQQDEQPLLDTAAQKREDLTAAAQREEASKVLLKAARLNLRRRFDLSLTLAFLGAHEDPNYLAGLRGALFGDWVGPSAMLGLSFDFPFANNVALGQLAQANALERQSEINRGNLARVIDSRVVELLGSLRQAAEEVRRLRQAVGYYQETIATETEKFKAGESTLVDTILTEEQLTNAEIALVFARQLYANLLAQLRFELGALVRFQNGEPLVEAAELREVPF